MDFGLLNILQIFGALAFFIYGMKMMSEGIQRAAGSQLRSILQAVTRNRFIGVLTGFFTTALVQSSSATTVMTVSFVNAGLVTLVQSAGIMMGANVGTTITAWLISVVGVQVSLGAISIPLFALGVPMLFTTRGNLKYWGEFIIGFGILFISINFLQDAVPSIEDNAQIFEQLQQYTDWGLISRIIFVMIGAAIAVILQSSTAAMAITLTLCFKGWLPLEIGAAMVLGENIGTTVTAELASLVGNTAARRSARIHSFFNLIGVTWMILLLPYFLPWIGDFVSQFRVFFEGHIAIAENLSKVNENKVFTLAAFHTIFNLLNVILLIGFVDVLVKVAIWSVKDRDGEEENTRLKFISSSIRTPELATIELMKETAHFGQIVGEMNNFANKLINATDKKVRRSLHKQLRKYEKISDRIEIEIAEYITRISNEEITSTTSLRMRSILNICNDLEQIGDLYYQLSGIIEEKNEEMIYFLPEQRNNLNDMSVLIKEAFKVMQTNLDAPDYLKVNLNDAVGKEKAINKLRDQLKEQNLTQLGKDGYNVKSAMVYNNVFTTLEKVGDHILDVSKSIVGEV